MDEVKADIDGGDHAGPRRSARPRAGPPARFRPPPPAPIKSEPVPVPVPLPLPASASAGDVKPRVPAEPKGAAAATKRGGARVKQDQAKTEPGSDSAAASAAPPPPKRQRRTAGVPVPAAAAAAAAATAAAAAAAPVPGGRTPQEEDLDGVLARETLTMDQRVTLTRGASVFGLTRREMDALPYKEVRNPHYRSAAPMRLYNVIVLYNASKAKYTAKGTTLSAARARRALAAARREETMAQRQTARRAQLIAALAAKHLELRGDSRLCNWYVEGSHKAWTLEATVGRMETMHILHVHTPYSAVVSAAYDEARGRVDRQGLRNDAEAECIDAYNQYMKKHAEAGVPASIARCVCGRPLVASELKVRGPDVREYSDRWGDSDSDDGYNRWGKRRYY
jgi:hypothetical protein